MPFSVWMGVKFAPGGHSTFFALLNTFVHIIMYFYYMVAAMGPQYQKFIWWKKYLTSFQMVSSSRVITNLKTTIATIMKPQLWRVYLYTLYEIFSANSILLDISPTIECFRLLYKYNTCYKKSFNYISKVYLKTVIL